MARFIETELILNINYSLYTWRERSQFILAFCLLPLIHILLKLTNVEITYQIFKFFSPQPKRNNNNINKAEKIKQITELIAKIYPRWAKCLRKSFLLWYLLRINQIDSNLIIGVRQQKNLFQSHAWVEFNGNPINETEDTAKTYKVLIVK